MQIPPERHTIIRETLDEYLASDDVWGYREFATQRQVLPLYVGWNGAIFLNLDGEFMSLNDDHPHELEPEADEAWQVVALVVASERHPTLAALLPQRPNEAIECGQCASSGRITIAGKRTDIVCGECSGLGWRNI